MNLQDSLLIVAKHWVCVLLATTGVVLPWEYFESKLNHYPFKVQDRISFMSVRWIWVFVPSKNALGSASRVPLGDMICQLCKYFPVTHGRRRGEAHAAHGSRSLSKRPFTDSGMVSSRMLWTTAWTGSSVCNSASSSSMSLSKFDMVWMYIYT